MLFQLCWKLDICNFSIIYCNLTNSSEWKRITYLKLGLEFVSKVQKQKKKNIVFLRGMDSIHYKEPLMLLGTYVAPFDLLILQWFYIKQKELIDHKLILILQRAFV
jgi:hypothetical protein